jgi:Undecaprenyl-phosphate glucose phosphotransferase
VSDFAARNSDFTTRVRPRIVIGYHSIAPLLVLADAIIIIGASIVGAAGYQLLISDSLGDIQSVVGMGVVSSLAYKLSARQLGLYRLQNLLRPWRDYFRIVASVLFLVLILTVTLFLLKVGSQVSRGSVLSAVVLVLCLLVAWRKFVKEYLRSALLNGAIQGRRTILIGTPAELASLSHEALLLQFGIEEATRIVLPQPQPDQLPANDIAAIDAAIDATREINAEELLLCVSWDDTNQLQLLREHLRVVPLPVRLLPDRFVRSIWDLQKASYSLPLLIDIQRAPLSPTEQFTKRVLDLVIASFALLVLSPLMLFAAVATKVETQGPIIFRQRRKGFNGREFQIYKFRTMRVTEDGPVICQATRCDGRVTRLGRILRRTSIDELPQLFNVFKGEMSIVGPRPHAVAHDDEYGNLIGRYAFRHHVKPGITGWAQVNGFRGGTPHLDQMKQRVERDLWYINNWSFGLDLQILARTCFELVRGPNAY